MDQGTERRHMEWKASRAIRRVGIAAMTAVLGACTSFPAMEGVNAIKVETVYATIAYPAVDVDGDPETRPGAMAMGALGASAECSFLFLLCAAVAVPISVVAGATITAMDTLPEDLAVQVNRLSAEASAETNVIQAFREALHQQAELQGLDSESSVSDGVIRFIANAFWWEVSAGNNLTLCLDVEASAVLNGQSGTRWLRYTSQAAPAEEWVANNGERIRQVLSTFMDDAAAHYWQKILNREQVT